MVMGKSRRNAIIFVFFLILTLPIILYVGDIRFSVYRLFFLITIGPLFFLWASQSVRKINIVDILLIFFCIWSSAAIIVNHSISGMWQAVGVQFIETLGPYLLGSLLIRNKEDFRKFIKYYFLIILIFIPIGVIESLTAKQVINDFFGMIFQTFEWSNYPPRLGFYRVQTVFEHPILFGVFCSSGFSLVYFLGFKGKRVRKSKFKAFLVMFCTFLSLSMGAYVAVIIQIGMMVWGHLTRRIKNSWLWLILGFALIYIVIDILSNRSPVAVFVTKFTFDSHTSYFRILIWDHATRNVAENPLFGLAFHEWKRPYWMPPSIDNYWLVIAVRFGLPALIFMVGGFLYLFLKIAYTKFSDPVVAEAKKAYLYTLTGLFVAMCTVHLWNATYVFFMFLIGAGVWFLNPKTSKSLEEEIKK